MDKELLFKHLQSKVQISEKEFALVSDKFERIYLKKKENLVEENKTNDRVFFVEKGLLFAYKSLANGNYQVVQFAKEDNWISDLYSFFSSSKALFTIQSIEDCQLISVSKKEFENICEKFPIMETYFRLSFQTAYVNTLQRLSDAYTEDAETKYSNFTSHQKEIVQRVPQYLIASYLGILPSSLSRIRKNKKKLA